MSEKVNTMEELDDNPLAALEGVGVEDIESLKKTTGLNYENYISIPKSEALPIMRVLDSLSKIASDSYAKNLCISTEGKFIVFRYNNAPYLFEYRIENRTGHSIEAVSIPINHIRKLLNNVNTNLIFVQEDGQMNVCLGENLLFVETMPFDKKYYDFNFKECAEGLDLPYMKDHLRSFSALLSATNNASEKNLICKDGVSYFNAGAILGKAKSFFGNHKVVISKIVLDAVSALVDETKSGILMNIDGSKMTLEFAGLAKCEFPVTTDPATFDTFLSPVFVDSFKYDNSVLVVNESLRQLLQVINAMDYFTSFVKIEFKESEFVLTAHRKEGGPIEYNFKYLEGAANASTINVGIPVLLAVLNKANNSTKYSTSTGNLIVDLGTVTFCIRSNS